MNIVLNKDYYTNCHIQHMTNMLARLAQCGEISRIEKQEKEEGYKYLELQIDASPWATSFLRYMETQDMLFIRKDGK